MRGSDFLGIVFPNARDHLLRELTGVRAMGSVPFGGRYRCIDFTLSNLVNAGVSRVGVITESNYQSLMDHLGSGKPWDLARKTGGMYILPPYGRGNSGVYRGNIDALSGTMEFLTLSPEEYVVLCNCDMVSNIDLSDVFDRHLATGADVTIVTQTGRRPEGDNDMMVVDTDEAGRVTDMRVSPEGDRAAPVQYSLGIAVLKRTQLISWVRAAASRNLTNLTTHVFLREYLEHAFYTYQADGYAAVMDSMHSYLHANMDLLKPEVRAALFETGRPVYTKIRDTMPVRYGLNAEVSDSLIADGCYVDGTVEHCILFRGVRVERGAVLKNCIIMQGGVIHENVRLEYVTTDKNVQIKAGHTLMGFDTYPVYIAKGSIV